MTADVNPNMGCGSTLLHLALQRASRTLPIVFVQVTDPVGAGLVDSLDRPGGSTTGFMLFEYSLSGKWVDLLKQIAPNVTRAAVIRDATNPSGIGQFSAIQGAAQSLAIEVSAVGIRDADEIQRGVAALARSRSSGLIVTGSATVFRNWAAFGRILAYRFCVKGIRLVWFSSAGNR